MDCPEDCHKGIRGTSPSLRCVDFGDGSMHGSNQGSNAGDYDMDSGIRLKNSRLRKKFRPVSNVEPSAQIPVTCS